MREQAVRDLMNTDVLVMNATLPKFVQPRSSDVAVNAGKVNRVPRQVLDIDWRRSLKKLPRFGPEQERVANPK